MSELHEELAQRITAWRAAGYLRPTLDELMAFAPCRDDGKRYAAAIRSGAAQVAHVLVVGSEDEVNEAIRTARPSE
jgi:hypothetical protein